MINRIYSQTGLVGLSFEAHWRLAPGRITPVRFKFSFIANLIRFTILRSSKKSHVDLSHINQQSKFHVESSKTDVL